MVRIRPYWLILALAIDAHAIGFNTNAWPTYTNLRLSNAIVTNVYAAFQSITFTNYTSPTSTVIITDTFLSDVWPTLESTNLITNRWAYPLTRYSGTVAWTYHYTAETAVARTPTNIAMQAQDVWGWDTYMSLQERTRFLFGLGFIGSSNFSYSPKFYRDSQRNLVAAKDWIIANASKFVLPSTNPVVGTNLYVSITASNLTASCGLPTNYLSWTPIRGLSGTGQPYFHLSTTKWTIATSVGGIVTQSTWDVCGNPVSIIGTNGQIVSKVCTNDNIDANFTSLDYGYPGITAIVSKLIFVASEMSVSGPGFGLATEDWMSPTTDSWNAAKSSIAPGISGLPNAPLGPGMWSIGVFQSGTTSDYYTAYYQWYTITSNKAQRWIPLTSETNYSGVQVAVELWGRAVTPSVSTPFSPTNEFEIPAGLTVNGVSWSTNWQALSSTIISNGAQMGVADGLGTNTPPPWCSEPTSGTPSIARGFYMKIIGLIRGDVTNGLRYR